MRTSNPRARAGNASPLNWSVDQVGQWLRDINLESYVDRFVEHRVDGEMLLDINSEEILRDELHVTSHLYRCKILRLINNLKRGDLGDEDALETSSPRLSSTKTAPRQPNTPMDGTLRKPKTIRRAVSYSEATTPFALDENSNSANCAPGPRHRQHRKLGKIAGRSLADSHARSGLDVPPSPAAPPRRRPGHSSHSCSPPPFNMSSLGRHRSDSTSSSSALPTANSSPRLESFHRRLDLLRPSSSSCNSGRSETRHGRADSLSSIEREYIHEAIPERVGTASSMSSLSTVRSTPAEYGVFVQYIGDKGSDSLLKMSIGLFLEDMVVLLMNLSNVDPDPQQQDEWERMLRESTLNLEDEGYHNVAHLVYDCMEADFKNDLRSYGMKKRFVNMLFKFLTHLRMEIDTPSPTLELLQGDGTGGSLPLTRPRRHSVSTEQVADAPTNNAKGAAGHRRGGSAIVMPTNHREEFTQHVTHHSEHPTHQHSAHQPEHPTHQHSAHQPEHPTHQHSARQPEHWAYDDNSADQQTYDAPRQSKLHMTPPPPQIVFGKPSPPNSPDRARQSRDDSRLAAAAAAVLGEINDSPPKLEPSSTPSTISSGKSIEEITQAHLQEEGYQLDVELEHQSRTVIDSVVLSPNENMSPITTQTKTYTPTKIVGGEGKRPEHASSLWPPGRSSTATGSNPVQQQASAPQNSKSRRPKPKYKKLAPAVITSVQTDGDKGSTASRLKKLQSSHLISPTVSPVEKSLGGEGATPSRGESASSTSSLEIDMKAMEKEEDIQRSYNFNEEGLLSYGNVVVGPNGVWNSRSKPLDLLPTALEEKDGLGHAEPNEGENTKFASDIVLLHPLGKGAGGTVVLGFHLSMFRLVAVKQVLVHDAHQRRQMRRELKTLLERLDHPNIVHYYDSYTSPSDGTLSMVFEYMDAGSLQDIVNAGTPLPLPLLCNVAFHCLRGLAYLHAKKFIHRDIKPSNLLISRRGGVKIADFGITASMDHTDAKANTYLGTVMYMSPERIKTQEYSFNCDIWSLGMSLLSCAFGAFPFKATGYWALHQAIQDQDIPVIEHPAEWADFVEIIYRAVDRNMNTRPGAQELLDTDVMKRAAQTEEQRLADREKKGPPIADCEETRRELDKLAGIIVEDAKEKLQAEGLEVNQRNLSKYRPSTQKVKALAAQLGLGAHLVVGKVDQAFRCAS